MSVARSLADVLQNHVLLEVEGIDRMYLNIYQPRLQTEKQAACFFRFHRGQPVASSTLMGVMTNAYLKQVDDFIDRHGIPVVQFRKGQRKDDVAAEYRDRFPGSEGVLFLGKAQEKANVFRTEREPGYRPSRSGATDLRASRDQTDAGALSYSCPDRGRRAVAARGLQEQQDRAVPQRGRAATKK